MNAVSGGESYTFETVGATYRFVFPYRTEWLRVISNGVGVAVIVVLLFSQFGLTLVADAERMSLVVLLLAAVFAVALAVTASEILWQLAGREVVVISDDGVVIRHAILGLGPARKFPAEKIDRLYASADQSWLNTWGQRDYRWFNFRRGRVALDSGKTLWGSANTFRFGTRLDDGEAAQVVGVIVGRFPQYTSKPAPVPAPNGGA